MIFKSYEVQKNLTNILKSKMILLYGENYGLKKEIAELIIIEEKQKNNDIEIGSYYESDITDNENIFYETIYSGSLFSNKKIITVNNCSDKKRTFLEISDLEINNSKLNPSRIEIIRKKSNLHIDSLKNFL